MRIGEVARLLDFSEMSIRRAWQAGDIPGIAYGTSCRILAAFVLALVAEAEAGRQVRIEDFGRQWATRNASPEAVA
jgi:hypothetical protein